VKSVVRNVNYFLHLRPFSMRFNAREDYNMYMVRKWNMWL
jgi:hypothetical protein